MQHLTSFALDDRSGDWHLTVKLIILQPWHSRTLQKWV